MLQSLNNIIGFTTSKSMVQIFQILLDQFFQINSSRYIFQIWTDINRSKISSSSWWSTHALLTHFLRSSSGLSSRKSWMTSQRRSDVGRWDYVGIFGVFFFVGWSWSEASQQSRREKNGNIFPKDRALSLLSRPPWRTGRKNRTAFLTFSCFSEAASQKARRR